MTAYTVTSEVWVHAVCVGERVSIPGVYIPVLVGVFTEFVYINFGAVFYVASMYLKKNACQFFVRSFVLCRYVQSGPRGGRGPRRAREHMRPRRAGGGLPKLAENSGMPAGRERIQCYISAQ